MVMTVSESPNSCAAICPAGGPAVLMRKIALFTGLLTMKLLKFLSVGDITVISN